MGLATISSTGRPVLPPLKQLRRLRGSASGAYIEHVAWTAHEWLRELLSSASSDASREREAPISYQIHLTLR